jgi:pectinesterase
MKSAFVPLALACSALMAFSCGGGGSATPPSPPSTAGSTSTGGSHDAGAGGAPIIAGSPSASGNPSTGGSAGSGGSSSTSGSGGSSAGAANQGGAGATGGGGSGGQGGTSTAGSSATAGSAGTGGSTVTCGPIASTATRPQLTSAQAASQTVLAYLAQHGTLGSLTTDDWNPTAGLGSAASFTPTFTVAANGSGTHTTVQAAIDATSGSTRQYILIKPGTYREVVSVTSGKPPITLYGLDNDATKVVIVNNQTATSAGGTAQSATFTSKANGFQVLNLTISNDYPSPNSTSQAVALYTTGDATVLENVRLHGFQDTLYLDTPAATTVSRVYIKNSFIEGDTDYIFGRATVVIANSTLNYLSSRKGTGSGVYLAPSTHVDNPHGFLMIGCTFTADAGAPSNKISLARSWDQGGVTPTPNGQALIRESTIGAHVNKTAPWAAAATSGRAYSADGNRFFEYCNSGPGAG